jgi:hypothetical protein
VTILGHTEFVLRVAHRDMAEQQVPENLQTMPSHDLSDNGLDDTGTIKTSRVERVFPIRIETATGTYLQELYTILRELIKNNRCPTDFQRSSSQGNPKGS